MSAAPHVVPFAAAAHLAGAAELLAARHRAARRHAPGLSAAYELPDACRAVIAAALRQDGAQGMAALQRGSMSGFLIGHRHLAPPRPRGLWVTYGGHAALAERDGRPLGFHLWQPVHEAAPDVPADGVELVVAVTDDTARGEGTGAALLAHGLAAAAAAGARWCAADWRAANLPAARFWHRHGFRPFMYRMARRLDERARWTAHD